MGFTRTPVDDSMDPQSAVINPRISNPTRVREFNTCTITISGTLYNCVVNEQPAWSITEPYTLTNLTPYFGGCGLQLLQISIYHF